MIHGNRSTYVTHRCRCDLCTRANADACREYYQRRKTNR